MSFSLQDVTRYRDIKKAEGEKKRNSIAACYTIIKMQDKINDTVRQALDVYLTNRLKTLSNVNLSPELFKSNIQELLEYCCDKNYNSITQEDVINNEDLILQNIKWCIEYKNTKRLIWDGDENYYFKDNKNMTNNKISKTISLKDLKDYFNIIE